jgi:hypothetical protein
MTTPLQLDITGGEWIVTPTQSDIPAHLTIRRADTNQPIAVVPPMNGNQPNWHDAALLCASKDLLNALIEIHEMICFSKKPISIEAIDEIVSRAAEKVNAEIVA